MAGFIWDRRFCLGVPEVDEQHRMWFALANAFQRLVESRRADRAAVQRALAACVAYASKHFRAEEALMRRIGFPREEFAWHRMTHDAFVERVNALAKRCREGRLSVVSEMSAFLCGWLAKHIVAVDVKYVGFYLSKTGWGPGTRVLLRGRRLSRLVRRQR